MPREKETRAKSEFKTAEEEFKAFCEEEYVDHPKDVNTPRTSKTISRAKGERIIKYIRDGVVDRLGKEDAGQGAKEPAKFRCWVRSKKFKVVPDPETTEEVLLWSENGQDRKVVYVEDFWKTISAAHEVIGHRSQRSKTIDKLNNETYGIPRDAIMKFLHLCPDCKKNGAPKRKPPPDGPLVPLNGMGAAKVHGSVRIKGMENDFKPAQCTGRLCKNSYSGLHYHCPLCPINEHYADPVMLVAHFHTKHVYNSMAEFKGMTMLKCMDNCYSVKLESGKTTPFQYMHWHCFACNEGFRHRAIALKHYRSHVAPNAAPLHVQIVQDINQGRTIDKNIVRGTGIRKDGFGTTTPSPTKKAVFRTELSSSSLELSEGYKTKVEDDQAADTSMDADFPGDGETDDWDDSQLSANPIQLFSDSGTPFGTPQVRSSTSESEAVLKAKIKQLEAEKEAAVKKLEDEVRQLQEKIKSQEETIKTLRMKEQGRQDVDEEKPFEETLQKLKAEHQALMEKQIADHNTMITRHMGAIAYVYDVKALSEKNEAARQKAKSESILKMASGVILRPPSPIQKKKTGESNSILKPQIRMENKPGTSSQEEEFQTKKEPATSQSSTEVIQLTSPTESGQMILQSTAGGKQFTITQVQDKNKPGSKPVIVVHPGKDGKHREVVLNEPLPPEQPEEQSHHMVIQDDGNQMVIQDDEGNHQMIVEDEDGNQRIITVQRQGGGSHMILQGAGDGQQVILRGQNGEEMIVQGTDGNQFIVQGQDGKQMIMQDQDGNQVIVQGEDGSQRMVVQDGSQMIVQEVPVSAAPSSNQVEEAATVLMNIHEGTSNVEDVTYEVPTSVVEEVTMQAGKRAAPFETQYEGKRLRIETEDDNTIVVYAQPN